jgi:translation initiation factor eIF-2B subunit delta
MGNAIRHLKDAIVKIDPDMEEKDAKKHLYDVIDTFLAERIVASDTLIAKAAAAKIENGDVVLTYAQSSVVKKTLLEAHAEGKSFRVIVVGSRPLYEGKYFAKYLAKAGITVEYIDIEAVWHSVNHAKKVILGAHAMMGNGALYSRVGTATVAMLAKNKRIPVIVCCESYKFTEKVYLDAITNNELAPPEELFEGGIRDKQLALYDAIPGLQALNVMYDITPADYVSMVVTEHGNLPPSAITAILRKQENARGNQT